MDTSKTRFQIHGLLACGALGAIASDQCLKAYCRSAFINNESASLFGFQWIQLTRVMNPGLLFHGLSSVPRGENEIFIRYLPTVALLVFIGMFIWTRKFGQTLLEKVGFILLVAGGASNLIDHWRSYYVMDTLKVLVGPHHQFQPFNLADAWITTGVTLLLATQIWELIKKPAVSSSPKQSSN